MSLIFGKSGGNSRFKVKPEHVDKPQTTDMRLLLHALVDMLKRGFASELIALLVDEVGQAWLKQWQQELAAKRKRALARKQRKSQSKDDRK